MAKANKPAPRQQSEGEAASQPLARSLSLRWATLGKQQRHAHWENAHTTGRTPTHPQTHVPMSGGARGARGRALSKNDPDSRFMHVPRPAHKHTHAHTRKFPTVQTALPPVGAVLQQVGVEEGGRGLPGPQVNVTQLAHIGAGNGVVRPALQAQGGGGRKGEPRRAGKKRSSNPALAPAARCPPEGPMPPGAPMPSGAPRPSAPEPRWALRDQRRTLQLLPLQGTPCSRLHTGPILPTIAAPSLPAPTCGLRRPARYLNSRPPARYCSTCPPATAVPARPPATSAPAHPPATAVPARPPAHTAAGPTSSREVVFRMGAHPRRSAGLLNVPIGVRKCCGGQGRGGDGRVCGCRCGRGGAGRSLVPEKKGRSPGQWGPRPARRQHVSSKACREEQAEAK